MAGDTGSALPAGSDEDHRGADGDARRLRHGDQRGRGGAADLGLEAGAACTGSRRTATRMPRASAAISGMKPRGRVTVDAGAVAALGRGKSLCRPA